jgi:hypothetical protein
MIKKIIYLFLFKNFFCFANKLNSKYNHITLWSIKNKAIISFSSLIFFGAFFKQYCNKKNIYDTLKHTLQSKYKAFISHHNKLLSDSLKINKSHNRLKNNISQFDESDDEFKKYVCELLVRGKAFKIFSMDKRILKKTKNIDFIFNKTVNFHGESFVEKILYEYKNKEELKKNWHVIRIYICELLDSIQDSRKKFMEIRVGHISFKPNIYSKITKFLCKDDINLLEDLLLFYKPD